MRVLLDTNIVIHRENYRVSNYSIGYLYKWLDKLKYTKIIHPKSVDELLKNMDENMSEIYENKISAYEILKTEIFPDNEFETKISHYNKSSNDEIDNILLYEVYKGRVDILITEDRKMLRKATDLGIRNKVFSINSFIEKATSENPKFIDYKVLAVEKKYFGEINLSDDFFDSFRNSYKGFDSWFNRKCDEEAYVSTSENKVLGFLYLKIEDEKENYSEITPIFDKRKRLKIGTFKVESTGFRLGERFIKIIFDNAVENNVDEIYVTMFEGKAELEALRDLLSRWGFIEHGIKETSSGVEKVFVKRIKYYDTSKGIKFNFPMFNESSNKYILPIFPKYHTTLLPDSILNTESGLDIIGNIAHRYALQKVYITWASIKGAKKGDLLLFYRNGDEGTQKRYSSVISTVGIIEEIISNYKSKDDFLKHCQNRSVFTKEELDYFWQKHHHNLSVIKFIYLKKLTKRPILNDLYTLRIVEEGNGPRPFTIISDEDFKRIMELAKTNL